MSLIEYAEWETIERDTSGMQSVAFSSKRSASITFLQRSNTTEYDEKDLRWLHFEPLGNLTVTSDEEQEKQYFCVSFPEHKCVSEEQVEFTCSLSDLFAIMNSDLEVSTSAAGSTFYKIPWRLLFFLNTQYFDIFARWRARAALLYSQLRLSTGMSIHSCKLIVSHAIRLEMHEKQQDWHAVCLSMYGKRVWHEFTDLLEREMRLQTQNQTANRVPLLLAMGEFMPVTPVLSDVKVSIVAPLNVFKTLPRLYFRVVCDVQDAEPPRYWHFNFVSDYSAMAVRFGYYKTDFFVDHTPQQYIQESAVESTTVEINTIHPGFALLFHIDWHTEQQARCRADSEMIYDTVLLKITTSHADLSAVEGQGDPFLQQAFFHFQNTNSARIEKKHTVCANLAQLQLTRNWYILPMDSRLKVADALHVVERDNRNAFPTMVNFSRCEKIQLKLFRRDGKSIVTPAGVQYYWQHVNVMLHSNGVVGQVFSD